LLGLEGLKLLLGKMLCENFNEKKIPFVVSYPKLLCYQKMNFGSLGVKPVRIGP